MLVLYWMMIDVIYEKKEAGTISNHFLFNLTNKWSREALFLAHVSSYQWQIKFFCNGSNDLIVKLFNNCSKSPTTIEP
jgi:hypothetical protein